MNSIRSLFNELAPHVVGTVIGISAANGTCKFAFDFLDFVAAGTLPEQQAALLLTVGAMASGALAFTIAAGYYGYQIGVHGTKAMLGDGAHPKPPRMP